MIVLAWLGFVIFFGCIFIRDIKKAPEMWECHYCHNEVLGLKECPYCGTKKEEAA